MPFFYSTAGKLKKPSEVRRSGRLLIADSIAFSGQLKFLRNNYDNRNVHNRQNLSIGPYARF